MKERQRKKDGIQCVTQIPDKAFHSNDDGPPKRDKSTVLKDSANPTPAELFLPLQYTHTTRPLYTRRTLFTSPKNHTRIHVYTNFTVVTHKHFNPPSTNPTKTEILADQEGINVLNIMYTFNPASTNPTKTEILADQERGKRSQYNVYKRNVFLTIMEFGRVEVRKICVHDCTIQVHLSPLRC